MNIPKDKVSAFFFIRNLVLFDIQPSGNVDYRDPFVFLWQEGVKGYKFNISPSVPFYYDFSAIFTSEEILKGKSNLITHSFSYIKQSKPKSVGSCYLRAYLLDLS